MKRCLNCMEEYEDNCGRCPRCLYTEGEESQYPYALKAGSILQGRYIVGTCRGVRDCDITYIGWDALFDRKILIQEFFPYQCVERSRGDILTVRNGMEELYSEGLSRFVHYQRNLIRLYKEEDIISIYSCFRANQTAYATMQFSEAMTLGQWIEQEGRLDEREALAFLYQAVQAVKKVHSLGLLHGDIRMDNFWMTGTGGLVLKGFAEPCHYCGDPEQKDYRNIGEWIDVYGLSRFFGEMLLGKEDIIGEDILEILDCDGTKLPVRTIMAVKSGLDAVKNHRILSLEEFSDRIFGDSATMRLVNRAGRSHGRGPYPTAKKGGIPRQDILIGAAAVAVILVAAVFFIMGRFTGTLSGDKGGKPYSHTADGHVTPGSAVIPENAAGAVTPANAALGKATPDNAAASKATPDNAAKGEATPSNAASGTAAPDNGVPETGQPLSDRKETSAPAETTVAETTAAGKSGGKAAWPEKGNKKENIQVVPSGTVASAPDPGADADESGSITEETAEGSGTETPVAGGAAEGEYPQEPAAEESTGSGPSGAEGPSGQLSQPSAGDSPEVGKPPGESD